MIKIHYNDTFLEVQESDSSYRYRSLMRKTQLVLKYSLPEYIEIPVGAWCEFQGQKFFLMSSQDFKKNGTRDIEYTLTMYDDEARLGLYKLRNPIDRRLKFSMCAKPHEFLEVIVAYMNERDSSGVWKVGTCIDAPEKTIEFNHTYCDEALQSVADAFETEYENNNHTISLRKVEYFKEDPLPLAYGRGNGFMPGVGRTTQSNELPIKRLYVQGGEQNIDRSKYGSAELLLPKNQTLEYEGRTYKSDAEGYYIERYDKVSDAVKDDSLDCSEIYPSRVGKVSSVECINAEKNFYDFIDLTIPEDLNFNDYIIEGETPYIRFQTGMLSGEKEFEFTYKHAERRFEIVPQEIDGVIMPNETFKPEAGVDTYAVFGINLPYDSEYVCDNKTQRGASWDMFREAARYLYEHEDQKFTFSGTLQSLWARRNWANVGGRLIVGGYILFTDNQFAKDGISIRIVGVKDFLTSPYSPTIEISNSVSGSSLSSQLKEIQNQEVLIDDTKKSIIRFTKRRFRDAQETMEMLEDSLLNFSNSINPITVQTMAALVGDESLQFRFVSSRTNLTQVNFQVDYNNETKQLSCPHSFLQHMTIGISSISSTHASNEYKIWEMSEFLSAVLDDASKKYYLYAKVSRDNTSEKGVFLLSEKSIALDDVSGYYHLLVGVLNSEYEGERSYVSLYGFTEILPGRITTDKIVSGNGESFFDMVANSMKLGDVLDFNTQGDGKLRLKGTLVQSQSGIEAPMGVYRGAYNSGYTYYQGDEVSYFDGNFTSTYRCTSATPIKGIVPTNTSYWEVIAQGSKGDDGVGINTVEEFYLVSSSATGVTTSTSGWKTTLQTTTADKRYLWNYEKITYSNSETVSSTPQVIGMYSEDGRGIKSITEYYQRSTSGSTAPTSWLTSPPALTSTYKYLWNYEVVTYTDDTTSQTEAAVIGIYGDKGDDGVAGDYYEYRYAVNGSTSTPPSLSNTSRNPRGWITSVLSVGNLQYLWQIVAKISGENDSLLTNWSTPVRITPQDGAKGEDGKSPALTYRGKWVDSKIYYGTENRVDAVKYGDTYFVARIDAGEIETGTLPTNTDKWNTFGAQFESVATELLLAEFAYIENLGVRHLLTAESGKRVHISGEENSMTIYDNEDNASIVMSGDVYSDSELFGGAEQSLSPNTFSGNYQTGNALHPNIEYTDTRECLIFSAEKAGVLSGTIGLSVSSSGEYSLKPNEISLMSGARLYAMLDNNTIGSVSIFELGNGRNGGNNIDSRTFNFSKNINPGTHKLHIKVIIGNPNYSTGSYSVSASAIFTNTLLRFDARMSRYFANGNAIGSSADQYVESITDSSSKVMHKVRSGNAGFEVYNGSFKIRLGGVVYTASVVTLNGVKVLQLT